MGRLAKSPGGSSQRTQNVGTSFVRALGGSRQAARSSPAARRAAVGLGGFLSGVAREGLAATAARVGVAQFLGQGVDALLAALTEVIAPAGARIEDAIARAACTETLTELFEEFDVAGAGPEVLNALDEAAVRHTIERFVANCITERLLQALAEQIETGAVTAARAVAVEAEVRDYVDACVSLEFGTRPITELAWDSREVSSLVQRLFEDGYAVLEAGT